MKKVLCCLSVLGMLLSVGVTSSYAEDLSQAPKLIYRETPSIPDVSEGKKLLTNRVEVIFILSADGSVENVEIATPSGSEAIDSSILESLKRWKFYPALDEKGVPKKTTVGTSIRIYNADNQLLSPDATYLEVSKYGINFSDYMKVRNKQP